MSERGKSYYIGGVNDIYGRLWPISRAYEMYLWERVKLRTNGIYPACDTDRIVEYRVVRIDLI
jgi:hypothetical protein